MGVNNFYKIWARLRGQWLIRYCMIVMCVYFPAITCTMWSETFKSSYKVIYDIQFVKDYLLHIDWILIAPVGHICPIILPWPTTYKPNSQVSCEIPFIKDYFFHIDWLLIIPVALLMFPKFIRNLNDCITNHLPDEHLPYIKGIGCSPLFRKWLFGVTGFSLTLTIIVILLDISTLSLPHKSLRIWYAPSSMTIPTMIYFFGLSTISIIIASVVFAYYCTVMTQLSKLTLRQNKSDLTWSVAQGGPIDVTLTSLLQIVCLLAFIPIGVAFGRTFFLEFSLSDKLTLFNIIGVPLVMFSVIVFPLSLTGIPRCLRAMKSELLCKNAISMSEIWEELSCRTPVADEERLSKRLDYLTNERNLIQKHYPVFPLSRHLRAFAGIVSLLPAAISIAGVIRTLLTALSLSIKQ